MSGQFLREAKHQCRPPFDDVGAVWRCDCGRRWVCVLDYIASPDGRAWKRRLLPWPRVPRGNREDPAETARWEAEKHATLPDGYVPPSGSLNPPRGGGAGSQGWGPETGHHCPGCRCGMSGTLTLNPRDVDTIKDPDGNVVAYLHNAQ